jgi:hypothetical protein
MNPGLFAERGYDKTVLYGQPVPEFEQLDDKRYQTLLNDQRNWASSRLVRGI